jgi:cell division protein FtsW
MKTDAPEHVEAPAVEHERPDPWDLRGGPVALLRGVLDRPLASYYLLLSTVTLLVLIGLVMVFSVTSVEAYVTTNSAFTQILRQLLWAGIGLVVFWLCQRLPARTFRALAGPLMIMSFVLMIFVDFMGYVGNSKTPYGQKVSPVHLGPVYVDDLWLHIGAIQIQPVELAKLALILWGADILVRKGNRIVVWRELLMPLFPVAVGLFVLVGYNDLGSMICMVILFCGLLWTAGARARIFLWFGTVALTGIVALIVLPAHKSYRLDRLKAFFDPSIDPLAQNGRYQYLRGLWAISNGGWFGVGLGQGHLKWGGLPNAHNDFIFAIIGEELGVVGCFMVLFLFGALTYTGLRIARRVEDPFRRLVAGGITIWFVGQAIVNIGGVVGLLPITGLPLPFISDGGTALVVALAAAGMLTASARTEPDAARALHARPPSRWVRLVWAPLPPLPRSEPPGRGAARGAPSTVTRGATRTDGSGRST